MYCLRVGETGVWREHVAAHVSVCVSLSNTRDSFQEFSTKARESGFQTHGFRKSKNAHRERFAKEMAKEKNEVNRTNIIGVLATAQIMMMISDDT